MSIQDVLDTDRFLRADESDPERYPMKDPDDISEANDDGFDDDDEDEDEEEDDSDDRDE